MPNYEQTYDGEETYILKLFGRAWELPVVEVEEDLYIASDAELILGDREFIDVAAERLAEEVKEKNLDFLVTVEAKAIGLVHSMAQELGIDYVVARKDVKSYMEDPLVVEVESITTGGTQSLVLNSEDVEQIRGSRVALIDDVVSTGNTMRSMEELLDDAGAEIVTKAAILEEGQKHEDVKTLGKLPVFRDRK